MSPAAANHISNSPLPINHTPDNPSEPDVVGGVGRQRVTDDKQPRIMKNTNDNTNLHQQHDLRTDGWLDMAHYHQLQQQQQQQNWPDYYSTGVICNWPFATPQQVIMPPFDNSSWQANTAAAENMSGGPPSYAGWPSTRRRHSSQHDDESTAAAAVEQQSLTHHHHPAPPWSFGGGAFTRDQGLVRRAAPRHSSNSSDVETAPFSAGWYHGVVTEQQQQQPRTVQRPVNLSMPPVDGGEPSAGPVHRHADQHRQFASPAVVAQHAYTQQQGRSAGLGADDAGARYYQPYSSPGIKMGSASGVRNDEQACGVGMSQVEPTTMGAVSPSAASPARIVHQQPRNQQPAVQHKATPTAMAAVPNTTDLLDVASIGLLPPAVVDGQQQSNEQQQQQQFLRSIGQTTVPAALTTTPAGKRMSGKTPTSRNPSSTRSRRGGGRSRMSAEVGRIARTKAAGKRVRPQHLLDALEQQVSDLTASKGQLEIKLSEKCTAVHFTANAISAKTAEIYNMKLRNLSLEEHDVTGCNPSALTCNSQPALRDLPHKHEPPGPKFKDAVKGLSQLMNHFLKSTGKQKGELEANIETHVGVLVRALMERCCSTSGEAYAGWVNATTEESVSGGHGALEHHPSQYIEVCSSFPLPIGIHNVPNAHSIVRLLCMCIHAYCHSCIIFYNLLQMFA
jgi:hypothetical protein